LNIKILAVLSGAIFLLSILSASSIASATKPGDVYTMDNAAPVNHVLQYQSGPGGALSLVGTFSTQGAGTGKGLASQDAVVLAQDGRWLLAVDAGSNEITVFQVNSNGSLSFADNIGSQGTAPISLAVSTPSAANAAGTPNTDLVYVLNNGTSIVPGNIAGFSLNVHGQLAYISGSTQPLSGKLNSSPEQIGFSTDGKVLVVTEKAGGVIDTYTVSRGGVASPSAIVPSNGGGPYGFVFTSQGYLLLTEAGTGSISSYAVSDSGSLRTLSGAIPDFGLAPCWIAVTRDGTDAYTSNAHGGTISGYDISGTGTLSLFSSVAAKTSIPTLDLAFSGNNQYLYVLNGAQITSFQVYPGGSIYQVSVTAAGGLPASTTGLAAS
jgi:6-phosphogluconolactonase (cycloisomerase 2 family)